jgi:hypothetical protein
VADEGYVPDVLNAHHARERAVLLVPPEVDAGGDLVAELLARHVRLGPAVGRDHASIGRGGVVDDLVDRLEVLLVQRRIIGPSSQPDATASHVVTSRPADEFPGLSRSEQ